MAEMARVPEPAAAVAVGVPARLDEPEVLHSSAARAGLISFAFSDRIVRAMDRDGNPWFVLVDACAVLGIENARDVAGCLDADEKDAVGIIDAIGRQQMTTVVSESGLWAVVLTSRKPEARAFRRWITAEVIPAIRKTGRYALPGAAPAAPDLNDPALLRQLLLTHTTKLIEAEEKITNLTGQVEVLEPKAAVLDRIAARSGESNVRETAKLLMVKEPALVNWCLANGWFYRRRDRPGGKLCGFKDKMTDGYLVNREMPDPDREDRTFVQVMFTPKGRTRLGMLLRQHGLLGQGAAA